MNVDASQIWRSLVLLGAGLSVGVLLVVMFWPADDTLPAGALLDEAGDPAHTDGQAGGADAAAAALPFGLDVSAMGGEPLDREPADLAVFGNARSVLRVAREAAGGLREEVSAWRIEGALLREVAAFYEAEAERVGFRRVEHPAAATGSARDVPGVMAVRNLLFIGSESRTQGHILTMRLAEQSDSIHALISLQYPVSP